MRLKLAAYIASDDWRKKYFYVEHFVNGFAAVMMLNGKYGKWGYVNTKGVEVVKPKYDSVFDFREGLAQVLLNRKYGFVNTEGLEVVKPQYDWVEDFHEGFAGVLLNRKYGFVNKEGVEIVKPQYGYVENFHEGLAQVALNCDQGWDPNCEWGLVNTEGEELLPPKYSIKYLEKYLDSLKTYRELGGDSTVVLGLVKE